MNPKYHLLIAVAALIMNACSTDDTCPEPVPENEGYKISFTVAEDTETRTTLEMLDAGNFLRWVSTDKVGVYTVGNNVNSNTLTTADVSQSPVEFVGTPNQPVSSGDQFYAYYPYNEMQSTDPKAVKLSIPAAQKQTQAGVYNGESLPMVAVPMAFSQEWGNAGHISSVRFRQLGAIVELQLYSSDETLRSESIRSVSFVSDTPLAGNFSFDLTTVTVKDELSIAGYESKVATTLLEEPAAIPAAGGKAVRVFLTIAPGQYTGKIVVNTDVAQYTFRLAKALTFKRAVIKGLPADLAKAERNADAFIHFEDAEVKRICVVHWDENGDGELSYEEAAAVKSIGVFSHRSSIRSFNELRYFTGLRWIEDSAFYECDNLTSVVIPDGVTEIGEYAFRDCISLTSVNIPDGVTKILYAAFNGCRSLKSITIPDGVTTIRGATFYGCSSLTSINLPNGVTAIGEYAFYNCSSLTSIHLPDGVTSIGECAFDGCSNLTSINIPDRVTTIKNSTFSGCSSLTSITIPDGVTAIGNYAFSGCSNLTNINIPEGVTEIGGYVFSGCSNLTSITIPDGVTTIGERAFENCSSLKNFDIPKKVTTIEQSAFFNCSSLKSITIPEGVTQIGGSTFDGCSSLTSIQLPDGLTSIGARTFGRCSSLTNITIPNGVFMISPNAFFDCSSLASIHCKPTTPPSTLGYPFSGIPSSMLIYVPAASVEAYKTAAGWSEHADQILADNN